MFGKRRTIRKTINIKAERFIDAMHYKLNNKRVDIVKHHSFNESLCVLIITRRLITFKSEEEFQEFIQYNHNSHSTVVRRGLKCIWTFEYPVSLEVYACMVNAFDFLEDLEPLTKPDDSKLSQSMASM